MGMGTLFCYNAFISCTDYFNALNPAVENVSGQMVTYQLTSMFIVTIALLPFSTLKKKDPTEDQINDVTNTGADNVNSSTTLNVGRGSYDIDKAQGRVRSHLRVQMQAILFKVVEMIDLTSPAKRVLYGFAFTFVFLFVYLLLPASKMTVTTLNLFSTFVGIADATSQSGLYVLAANYAHRGVDQNEDDRIHHHQNENGNGNENGKKPMYTASATLGAALSGFIVSALRLITRSMYDTTTLTGLKKGADLLMRLAFAVSIILVGAAIVMMRDLNRRYTSIRMLSDATRMNTISFEGNIRNQPGDGRSMHSHTCTHTNNTEDTHHARHKQDIKRQHEHVSPTIHTESGQSSQIQRLGNIYRSAFRLTWKPILSAFLNFFLTLSLFPGVIVDIPSSSSDLGRPSLGNWLPIVLIAIFNGSDCLGRYILAFESMKPFQLLMAHKECCAADRHEQGDQYGLGQGVGQGHVTLQHYTWLVWIPTFGRIIFYPLLAMCMLPSESPMIQSDILTCIIIFLFGLSNGFIHCANFTVAPTLLESEEAQNAVSLLLLLAIYSGLTLGAFFGLLVEKVIRDVDG